MYDNNMKFVDTHEWVRLIDDNVVVVGITHHAKELLGDLVYIDLPKVGRHINVKEVCGVVESVKAASDLYSPLSGEVVEINHEVVADPTLINSDPHGRGWLFKIKLSDATELSNLMSMEEYKSSISGE